MVTSIDVAILSRVLIFTVLLFSMSKSFSNGDPSQTPGEIAFYEGRYEDAISYFEDQLAEPSLKNESLIYLSQIYLRSGDPDKAILNIEEALSLEPTDADEIRLSADIYCNKAQNVSMFSALKLAKKCIRQYEAAVAADPTNIQALASATQFYLEAPSIAGGSKETGSTFLARLAKLSPEDANIIRIKLLMREGEQDAARSLADTVVENGISSAKKRYEVAHFYRDIKAYKKAYSLFESLIPLEVTHENRWYVHDALLQTGEILLVQEVDIERSVQLIERYKQLNTNTKDPHYFWATWSLAKAYYANEELGKYQALVASIKSEDYKSNKVFAKQFEKELKRRK